MWQAIVRVIQCIYHKMRVHWKWTLAIAFMVIILVISRPPKTKPAPANDDRLLRELNATLVDPLFYVHETQIIQTDTIYESELRFTLTLDDCTELLLRVYESAKRRNPVEEDFLSFLRSGSIKFPRACADAALKTLRSPMDEICAAIHRHKPTAIARAAHATPNWLVGPATNRSIDPIVLFSLADPTQVTTAAQLNFTETKTTIEYNLNHVYKTYGQNESYGEEIVRSTIYGIYKLGETRRVLEHAAKVAAKGQLDAYLYSRLQYAGAQREDLKYQVPIDCIANNPLEPTPADRALEWKIILRYPKIDPNRDQFYRVRSIPVIVNNCTVKYVGPPFVKLSSSKEMCYPADFYVYRDVVVNVPCSETPKFQDLWKAECEPSSNSPDIGGVVHSFPDDKYLIYCTGKLMINQRTYPCPSKPFLLQTMDLSASITNVRTSVEHPTGDVLFSPETTLEYGLKRSSTSWRDLADARGIPIGIGFLGGLLARISKFGNAIWNGVKFIAAPFTAFGRAIWNNISALIAALTGFSIADAFSKIEPVIQWLLILGPIAIVAYFWFFRKKPQPVASPPVVFVPTAPSIPAMSEHPAGYAHHTPRYY